MKDTVDTGATLLALAIVHCIFGIIYFSKHYPVSWVIQLFLAIIAICVWGISILIVASIAKLR